MSTKTRDKDSRPKSSPEVQARNRATRLFRKGIYHKSARALFLEETVVTSDHTLSELRKKHQLDDDPFIPEVTAEPLKIPDALVKAVLSSLCRGSAPGCGPNVV